MTPEPWPLQAAIFDLDGTLVDSEPLYAESDWIFLEKHGIRLQAGLEEFLGIGTRDFMLALAERFPDNPLCTLPLEERIRLKDEGYIDWARGRIRPFEGVVTVARELAQRGIALAVASGSSPKVIDFELDSSGLRELFAVVVSASEVERGKPDPQVFLEAARRLGVESSRCIVFEDSGPGIIAARRAGMTCVAMPTQMTAAGDARFMIEGGAGALVPGPFIAALEVSGLLDRIPSESPRGA